MDILIVEPHKDNRELLELSLKKLGYGKPAYGDIYTVLSAEEALDNLEWLHQNKMAVHLLITARERLGMPVEQVIARARGYYPLLKVIVTTTDYRKETRDALLREGADNVLLKPYRKEELIEVLKE